MGTTRVVVVMKWVELVRVRSLPATLEGELVALEAQVNEINGSMPDAEALLLQHALYDGDLAVVLVWRNDNEPSKSREGLMVAERLQRLGSIDHAVWVPTREMSA